MIRGGYAKSKRGIRCAVGCSHPAPCLLLILHMSDGGIALHSLPAGLVDLLSVYTHPAFVLSSEDAGCVAEPGSRVAFCRYPLNPAFTGNRRSGRTLRTRSSTLYQTTSARGGRPNSRHSFGNLARRSAVRTRLSRLVCRTGSSSRPLEYQRSCLHHLLTTMWRRRRRQTRELLLSGWSCNPVSCLNTDISSMCSPPYWDCIGPFVVLEIHGHIE